VSQQTAQDAARLRRTGLVSSTGMYDGTIGVAADAITFCAPATRRALASLIVFVPRS